ncbi:MAG: ROK family protein [Kiritimatiellaeota bacterium]|nr:ROK family protein [Kiritimatiellota bacterium]
MKSFFPLPSPKLLPVLDPGFRPPVLAHRAYAQMVEKAGGGLPLVLTVERDRGIISRYETRILPWDHPKAAANYFFVERLVKFLVWQWGGWRVTVAGSPELARFLAHTYSAEGVRAFDAELWGDQVYNHEFTVESVSVDAAPPATPVPGSEVRLDWTGWRIGFDLGASDRKAAVVKDGELARNPDGTPLFSEEYPWDPRPQSDPNYHFEKINEILRLAEKRIREVDPGARVQAIGGSAAGIYVNGRPRIASLFRGIEDREVFEAEIAPLFERIREDWGGIPFRLENDGDVTALAGAISLADGAVLGLAMGSSLAGGYVDERRCIAGWMNELAFVPVDYNPAAPEDEWSRDRGAGAIYFSQQAVGRLIPVAGIEIRDIPEGALPERLVRVQELMAAGDERARKIYETIGRYFGYAVAQFCDFYSPVRHVEVLGRVMTGEGGQVILDEARTVLEAEFPALADAIDFYEPGEQEKRHGQAAAAAHLPEA